MNRIGETSPVRFHLCLNPDIPAMSLDFARYPAKGAAYARPRMHAHDSIAVIDGDDVWHGLYIPARHQGRRRRWPRLRADVRWRRGANAAAGPVPELATVKDDAAIRWDDGEGVWVFA